MNKTVYLGHSILDLSKMLMYYFWSDYVKLKYGKKAKLCYMDTDNFMFSIKADNICKDIADVETRFLTLQILNQIDNLLKEKIKK